MAVPREIHPSQVIDFSGRTALLATRHRKEQVIAPLLAAELGVKVTVPVEFDSDQFGTFTREVPRPGSQFKTARAKALAALEGSDFSLALASEGAFGPHPAIPWLACDRELVLFIDRQHGLEIAGEALSTDTNYRQQTVTTVAAAREFAEQVGFPSHGLIVGAEADQPLAKGMTDGPQLEALVAEQLAQHGQVWLETDMRAMHNPRRQRVIAAATEDLVRKLQQRCPQCAWPGFDVVRREPGLLCAACGLPTQGIRRHIYGCTSCGYEMAQDYPDGRQVIDPGQCAFCNP